MKSILEEIYNGKRGNASSVKDSEKYKEYLNKYCEALENFRKALPEEQHKTFNEILDMACGLEDESGIENFKEGFKLGMLIAMETLE